MIIITGVYNVQGPTEGTFLVQNLAAEVSANGPAFTQIAIESTLPGVGKIFIALLCFHNYVGLLLYR